MRILWDKDKARINEEKHGVTFEEAAEVLLGHCLKLASNAKSERRYIAISRNRGEYLTVAYTERKLATRIISARHSSAKEKLLYERDFNNRI